MRKSASGSAATSARTSLIVVHGRLTSVIEKYTSTCASAERTSYVVDGHATTDRDGRKHGDPVKRSDTPASDSRFERDFCMAHPRASKRGP